jgi:hypothetical protein
VNGLITKSFDGPFEKTLRISYGPLAQISSARLIERYLIAGAIIKLGGAWTLICCHGLRVFQRAAGFQIGGDPGCRTVRPSSAARRRIMCQTSTLYMASPFSVPVRHRADRNRGLFGSSRMPAALMYSSRNVSSLWCAGISWRLPPFSCRRTPPALAVGKIILDAHGDDGADAGKGIGHDADHGAVAQADGSRRIDAVEQQAGLVGRQHRGLASPNVKFGLAARCAWDRARCGPD